MGKLLFAEKDGIRVLKFIGDVRLSLGPTISSFLDRLKSSKEFKAMVIDLSETETIDSTALGLIAKVAICTRETFDVTTSIISPRDDITRILESMAMQEVCVVTADPLLEETELRELPQEICSEEAMREQVLDAHKILMGLDDDNFEKFHDLVEALELEKPESRIRRHAC